MRSSMYTGHLRLGREVTQLRPGRAHGVFVADPELVATMPGPSMQLPPLVTRINDWEMVQIEPSDAFGVFRTVEVDPKL